MEVDILLRELNFKAIRSSGPGGQHVNKTASKIELNFHIENSQRFRDIEKKRLLNKLKSRISQEGSLVFNVEKQEVSTVIKQLR